MSSRRRPYNQYRAFTDFATAVNLRAQPEVVASPALRLRVTNTGATLQTITVTGPDGESVPYEINPTSTEDLDDIEFYTIESADADIDHVVAFWLDEGQRKNPPA